MGEAELAAQLRREHGADGGARRGGLRRLDGRVLTRDELVEEVVTRTGGAALEDRLVSVEVAGEQAYALAEDADELAATRASTAVRLLPGFDQYVLGAGTNAVEVIPAEHRAAVSRAAGWISPVVVTGGRVTGVWEIDGDTLEVRPFDDAAGVDRDALEAEVAHIARYLGRDLALRCSRS